MGIQSSDELALGAMLKEKTEKNLALTDDEKALYERINTGLLTTLEIMQRIFYVDFTMGILRAHNDFRKNAGIAFNDLSDYLTEDRSTCVVPYDTKKKALADLENGPTENDKWVLVSFPAPHVMDPVGHSRTSGDRLKDILIGTPQKSHFNAKIISAEDQVLKAVNTNRTSKGLEPLQDLRGKITETIEGTSAKPARKRGRRM